MSETQLKSKHLKRRPDSSYRRWSSKGRRIWGWTLYREFRNENEPRTPQQLAEDFDLPLETVHEAIAYGQSDPPEVHDDHRQDEALPEAAGMNHPNNPFSGRPRPFSTAERVRLAL